MVGGQVTSPYNHGFQKAMVEQSNLEGFNPIELGMHNKSTQRNTVDVGAILIRNRKDMHVHRSTIDTTRSVLAVHSSFC
jgi:hypothetical protein